MSAKMYDLYNEMCAEAEEKSKGTQGKFKIIIVDGRVIVSPNTIVNDEVLIIPKEESEE